MRGERLREKSQSLDVGLGHGVGCFFCYFNRLLSFMKSYSFIAKKTKTKQKKIFTASPCCECHAALTTLLCFGQVAPYIFLS